MATAQQSPEVLRAELGFGDQYKVGCWTPLKLVVVGGEMDFNAVVEVRVPDNEGTPTSIPSMPFSLAAGQARTVEMLVRIGQLEAPLDVRLLALDGGKVVARRTFTTMRAVDDGGVPPGNPATTRLLVEVGPTQLGAASVNAAQGTEQWYTQNVVARVNEVADLPRHWMAYEAVDTVLLSTSDRDAWATIREGDPRVRALSEWVEMGGRVVLFAGPNSAEVLGSGGPLRELAPGTLRDVVTIDDLGLLEKFVDRSDPLPGRGRVQLGVPRLTEVRGDVELEMGSGDARLPLVVRARHGLGQVVYVAFDADVAPLRDWNSRNAFVAKLLDYRNDTLPTNTDDYYYSGPADIATGLQQRLDQELETSGIKTPPFLAIAGLVLLYILLIGPGDYWLVKRVFKRMEWTWVTFPAIVVLTCLAAYWYADYLKGDDLRINQVEIVDVDTTTGLTRGTMWTHLFSPRPERYYLALEARTPDGQPAELQSPTVAWFGRADQSLGGMNAEAGMSLGGPAYGWSPDRSVLNGVPVEVWSTKTFASRWQSESPETISAELIRTSNELVIGTLTNNMDADLAECKLVYGDWAWRIDKLSAGETTTIEPVNAATGSQAPRKTRTLYQQDYDYNPGESTVYEQMYLFGQIDLWGIGEMMMFHDLLGGRRQSKQWHRYQHFVDLSRSLDRGTAMLIARCRAPRSELVRLSEDGQRESMRGDKDLEVVLYRFVLPVNAE